MTAQSETRLIRHYPEAGKVQVVTLYLDDETGELRPGKLVALDKRDLQGSPQALALLRQVLDKWAAQANELPAGRDEQ